MTTYKHIDFEVPGFGELDAGPQVQHRYRQLVLDAQPIAWWRLAETAGLTAVDEVSGIDGTYQPGSGGAWTGGTQGTAGLFPQGSLGAARFDGSGYVAIPNHDLINTAATYDYKTVASWFKVDDAATDWQIIYEEGGQDRGLCTYVHQGYVYGCIYGIAPAPVWLAAPVQSGQAHHFVMVYDGIAQTFDAYLDGVQVGHVDINSTVPLRIHGGAVHIAYADSTRAHTDQVLSNATFGPGVIDEIILFNVAVDATTVAAWYAAATQAAVTLSQTAAQAFPDRPNATAGTALRAECQIGFNGAYVEHGLTVPASRIASRFLFHRGDAAGGEVTLLTVRGDDAGDVAELTWYADTRQMTLSPADGDALQAELVEGLAWHCVEVLVSTDTGAVSLAVNGITFGESTTGSAAPIASMRLGAMDKSAELVGSFCLDEWVIGDGPIGPVRVAPTSAHADAPRRWLVIYNTAIDQSAEWAEHYRQARQVPYANLLGLALPAEEVIDEAALDAFRIALNTCLDANGLRDQILGLLLGFGVPGYAQLQGETEPIGSLLQTLDGQTTPLVNEQLTPDGPQRPTIDSIPERYLTARIDAPTLKQAIALIDHASSIMAEGLGDGADATLWLDPVTPGITYGAHQQATLDWAESLAAQALRLPLVTTQPTDPPTEVNFNRIEHDGFYWGRREVQPPAGFFGEPSGRRVFAAQLNDTDVTAPTLRTAQHPTWGPVALEQGYAATIGISRVVTPSVWPLASSFFGALGLGWAIAEAWWASCPLWRAGVCFIGDPLMKVAFPRRGWNVYGPAPDWSTVDLHTPTAMLRPEQTSIALVGELEPSDQQVAIYVVRPVDEHGREATGLAFARQQRDGSLPRSMPGQPVWPTAPNWSAERVEQAWRVRVQWPLAMGQANVAQVELIAQLAGESPQVVQTLQVDPWERGASLDYEPTSDPVRLAIRAHSPDGGSWQSPWSAWLTRSSSAIATLHNLPHQ